MNCKTIFRNLHLAVFVLCMGLILCPNDTAAFSLKSSDIDRIVHSGADYKINTIFMEVYQKKGYVTAGERVMYLMDFKAGGKHYRTVFINEKGDISYAASVKNSQWEGKRVIIKGYKLDSGDVVAESIEKVTNHHK
jgi:hypothetical protein